MGLGDNWRWRALLLLLLLLAVMAALGAGFIFWPQPPLHTDPVSNLIPSVLLRQAVEEGSLEAWRTWLEATGNRPPLPGVLYLPALLAVEDQVAAIRAVELAALLLCLVLLYRLGESLAGGAAGLLAAALFGLFPPVLGWSHWANADPLIWLGTLLVFSLLLRLDLDRPRQAVALGLAAGFCLGVRLVCVPYLVGAGLFVLASVGRRPRRLANLGLAGVAALAVSGWWFVYKAGDLVAPLAMAAGHHPASMGRDLGVYQAAGLDLFLVGAALAWAAALRGRLLSRRHLLLFALWILLPLAQFLLVWDAWARYLLPLVPQCALLVAVVIERLGRTWSLRARAATRGTLLALAVLPLLGLDQHEIRYDQIGPVFPAWERFDGFWQAVAGLPPGTALVAVASCHDPRFLLGINLSRRVPPLRLYDLPGTSALLALEPGVKVSYLLHSYVRKARFDLDNAIDQARHAHWRELRQRQPMTLVRSGADPDGGVYDLYRFPRPLGAEELAQLPAD